MRASRAGPLHRFAVPRPLMGNVMLLGGVAIDLSLVPFGFHSDTRELLDVHEVPKGKGCACTCPSCGMPLVARQGSVREWHFAHQSRGASATAQRECEYSFFVSVRLMAKQLLEGKMTVSLPALYGHTHSLSYAHPREVAREFLVTEASSVTLRDLQTDVPVNGVTVDIQGKVGNYSLAIYLAYKGRPVPDLLRNSTNQSCGIIAISLDRTRILFRDLRQRRNSNYRTELVGFLADDLDSKEWVYHPRYHWVEQKAIAALEASQNLLSARNATREEAAPILPREAGPIRTSVVFECVMCQTTWNGIEESSSPCPKCNTHLYRRVKQRICDAT